ncbi:MAG: hypothetical protein MZV63_58605 [Marinilabiliales bacterium]|nr:hypothetical protein [Marinilabiliales bacterium]
MPAARALSSSAFWASSAASSSLSDGGVRRELLVLALGAGQRALGVLQALVQRVVLLGELVDAGVGLGELLGALLLERLCRRFLDTQAADDRRKTATTARLRTASVFFDMTPPSSEILSRRAKARDGSAKGRSGQAPLSGGAARPCQPRKIGTFCSPAVCATEGAAGRHGRPGRSRRSGPTAGRGPDAARR